MMSRSATKLSPRPRPVATLLVFIATVLSACGGGGGSTGVTATDTTSQTEATAASATEWRVAATEGANFTVTGTQLTRYGVEGNWVEKWFTDAVVECGNATYGDPLVGTVKSCQVSAGASPLAGAAITVQAASEECEGRADLALRIKGVEVTRWRGILGNARDAQPQYQALSYQHDADVALADVEIAFVNDHWTPSCNRNVRINSVQVTHAGGAVEVVKLAEQSVYSTGTWSAAEKCGARYVQSEWLDCNGAFRLGQGPERIEASFEADGAPLLNPERGFYVNTSMVASNHWGAASGNGSYATARGAGQTLVRGIALLDKHRGGPLPESVLNELRQGFGHARNNGLKVWFKAAYNFPSGPGGEKDATKNIDPELAVVQNHLDQLKPIFEENKDVIAGLYNGFIGAWGEWHSSSTGLHQDPQRRQIWEKILQSVPADRMMTVRYFGAIDTLVATHPTKDTAYDQSAGARTGMTNQCYLVNTTDAGTFDQNKVAEQKAQLSSWTRYVPFVAETCESPYTVGNRHDCASAKAENELLHLSALNSAFYKPILDGWKAQGCYDEIANRLGYRFELKNASVQKQVRAGTALQASFVVKNVGYAAPYNPRGLALVLRNQSTGVIYPMSILQPRSDTLDPRNWHRESGEISVSASPTVPADVPAGAYDVLLSLHDPMPNLSGRPEYSIRLANQDVWDSGTGLNKLISGVTVTK
jgi:hypothetical protein